MAKKLNRPYTGLGQFLGTQQLRLQDNKDPLLVREMKKMKVFPWPDYRQIRVRERMLAKSLAHQRKQQKLNRVVKHPSKN